MKTLERCKSKQLDQVILTVHMTKWHKENEAAKQAMKAAKDLKIAIICASLAIVTTLFAIGFYAGSTMVNHSVVEHHKTEMYATVVQTEEPSATPIPTTTPTPEPTATPEPTPEPEPTEILPVGFKYLDIPLSEELQLHAAKLCEQSDCMWYSLMLAIMNIETGGTFSNDLVSSMGAQGIMQVMPDNIRSFCAQTGYTYEQVVTDPKINMECGIWVWELGVYNYSATNTAGYLMRYNAGPGNAAPMIEAGIISSYASTALSYEAMYNQMLGN